MWAYFDTSALIKRYIKDTGRREVWQLLRRYDVVTSVIVPAELRSALRRRASEGTLDAEKVPEVLKRVATDRAYWTLVEIASSVELPAQVVIGPGLYLPHIGYLVVASNTVIGSHCTLTQGVSIGHRGGGHP